MKKPNWIASPTLINILQGSKREYLDGIVTLYYDSDKIMLDVTLHDDNHLEVSLWIGSDKKVTVRDTQKMDIFNFIQEFYKKERAEWTPEKTQDHKEDLSFDNVKEN